MAMDLVVFSANMRGIFRTTIIRYRLYGCYKLVMLRASREKYSTEKITLHC